MEGLITAASGPFGALALSVGILVWLARSVVPVLKAYLEGQTEKLGAMVAALNKTVDAHEADRKTFEASIAGLTTRIDKVETVVEKIQAKMP